MELRPRKLIQEERRCEHSSEQYFPERDGLPSKTNSLPQQAQTVVFALRYRLSCQLLFTRASERLSQRICVQWLRALAVEVERADLVAVGQLLSCSQGGSGRSLPCSGSRRCAPRRAYEDGPGVLRPSRDRFAQRTAESLVDETLRLLALPRREVLQMCSCTFALFGGDPSHERAGARSDSTTEWYA